MATILGVVATVWVAALALRLSAGERAARQHREHQDVVEVFWQPLADAADAVMGWDEPKDLDQSIVRLQHAVAQMRQAMPRSVRAQPSFAPEVAKVRSFLSEANSSAEQLLAFKRHAYRIMRQLASEHFGKPDNDEMPTLQYLNEDSKWEYYSPASLLSWWLSGLAPDMIPELDNGRLLYADRNVRPQPYVVALWSRLNADRKAVATRENLKRLQTMAYQRLLGIGTAVEPVREP